MTRAGWKATRQELYEDGQEPSPSPYDPEYLTYLNVAALRISRHAPEPTSDDDDPVEPCAERVLELCFAGQLKEAASWNRVNLPIKRPRDLSVRHREKSKPKPLPVCRIRFTM